MPTSTWYLKLAYLSVKREEVEDHGTDEGDVGGLAVVDPLPPVYPQSGQLGEDRDCAESFQVVNKYIGNPEAVY